MLNPRLRSLGAGIALSVAVAGCSAGDTTSSTDAPPIPSTSSTVATDAMSTVPEAQTSNDPIAATLGLPGITIVTPESGGGARPELAWRPVDDAFFYNVVLFGPSGRAYWGWEGTTTSVHVGGEPVIKEGLSGPSVIEGMFWQVSAYDNDLNLIALSHQQPIGP